MKKILAITLKELGTYFKSPMAYIVLVITTSIFNIFFFIIIDQNREASLRDMFKLMEFMFVFIAPLLTMKLFAEERRAGTLEFLMTCPVKNTHIVLGKYFGSLAFFSVLIAMTLIYYFLIEYFSAPDRASVATGYLGIWLEGALFVAIGILISAWTGNQMIAAISSYMVLLMLYFSIAFIKYLPAAAHGLIRYFSFWSHTENFTSGLIESSDIIYFLSTIIFCIFLTILSIERQS